MKTVRIRALKQNASAVVAQAAQGDTITITDRNRPVAQLTAIPARRLAQLVAAGAARPPRRPVDHLPDPKPGPALSEELRRLRDEERF